MEVLILVFGVLGAIAAVVTIAGGSNRVLPFFRQRFYPRVKPYAITSGGESKRLRLTEGGTPLTENQEYQEYLENLRIGR